MILIVDDRQENILSLRKILELNGFAVDTALSGEEALKKILRNEYYLVILDVQMPEMDGFEVAEAITGLNRTRNVPILFLSAINTHKKFISKGFSSGGVDYLTKPFDPDILIMKVKTFYKMYQQTRELNSAHQLLKEEIETRKRTERNLVDTVHELHSTLESLPQIAFTLKNDGSLDYVNGQWLEFADDERSFPATHPQERSIQEQWEEARIAVKPLNTELRIKEKSTGEYLYFLLRIFPVSIQDKIIKWVGTFTNIHHQHMMNQLLEQKVAERTKELLESNVDLEASNNDLQQFASVASHDLREPLRKITFFSGLIHERFNPQGPMADYLDKINHASRRMNDLIEDLLNFSLLSSPMEYEHTSLQKIVEEVLTDLELQIQEKKASVQVGVLPEMDVFPGLMRQLFQNLLSNALKFSKEGIQPVIKVVSTFHRQPEFDAIPEESGDYIQIRISDNGIGFEPRFSEKIFTLFQRLHNRDEYSGTGIGLTIVKKIVMKHHGQIRAISQPGEGSSFQIILPLAHK